MKGNLPEIQPSGNQSGEPADVGIFRMQPGPPKDELVDALEDYIKLLGEELSELAGFAMVHGWKSKRVEQGAVMRENIMKLKVSRDMARRMAEQLQNGSNESWNDYMEKYPTNLQ
jgi:hypothetical protein